ncbi:MAG: hypothetical protein ACRCYU_21665 [Nocardioides sp.]
MTRLVEAPKRADDDTIADAGPPVRHAALGQGRLSTLILEKTGRCSTVKPDMRRHAVDELDWVRSAFP